MNDNLLSRYRGARKRHPFLPAQHVLACVRDDLKPLAYDWDARPNGAADEIFAATGMFKNLYLRIAIKADYTSRFMFCDSESDMRSKVRDDLGGHISYYKIGSRWLIPECAMTYNELYDCARKHWRMSRSAAHDYARMELKQYMRDIETDHVAEYLIVTTLYADENHEEEIGSDTIGSGEFNDRDGSITRFFESAMEGSETIDRAYDDAIDTAQHFFNKGLDAQCDDDDYIDVMLSLVDGRLYTSLTKKLAA